MATTERTQREDDVAVSDLPAAVVADDLAMVRLSGGRMELYTVSEQRAHLLGTFQDPAAAWQALDAVDFAA